MAGNKSKCRGLLRKGKDFGAKPKELLLKAYDNFVAGKKVLIDDCDELTLSGFSRLKQKSSESSVDSSPLSTGTQSLYYVGYTIILGGVGFKHHMQCTSKWNLISTMYSN